MAFDGSSSPDGADIFFSTGAAASAVPNFQSHPELCLLLYRHRNVLCAVKFADAQKQQQETMDMKREVAWYLDGESTQVGR